MLPRSSNFTSIPNDDDSLQRRRLLEAAAENQPKATNDHTNDDGRMRILYTVTTLAEYDTGGRATSKGFDRLKNTVVPILKEGIHSMMEYGHHVDLYLVCHYEMKPERLQMVKDALPDQVQVRVWDDSTPISYIVDDKKGQDKVVPNTRSLSRQHRFVVRDHLFEYDLFVNFEDDMVIKGPHVQHYMDMTRELYQRSAG